MPGHFNAFQKPISLHWNHFRRLRSTCSELLLTCIIWSWWLGPRLGSIMFMLVGIQKAHRRMGSQPSWVLVTIAKYCRASGLIGLFHISSGGGDIWGQGICRVSACSGFSSWLKTMISQSIFMYNRGLSAASACYGLNLIVGVLPSCLHLKHELPHLVYVLEIQARTSCMLDQH